MNGEQSITLISAYIGRKKTIDTPYQGGFSVEYIGITKNSLFFCISFSLFFR